MRPMHRLFRPITILLLTTLLLGTAIMPAVAQDSGLLPVAQAFRLEADAATPGQVTLHWTIAPHYYLYRSRIHVRTADTAVKLGTLQLPDGLKEHDKYLGDIEIYHGRLTGTLPYTAAAGTKQFKLAVQVQGCHEVDPKICYPPHTETLTVNVPAATAGAAANGPRQLGLARGTRIGDQPLPAQKAFAFDAIVSAPDRLLLRWSMPKGYYLYRDKTTLSVADGAGVQLGTPRWPDGVAHHDAFNGDAIVYYGQLELPVPLTRTRGEATQVTLTAHFQGCKEDSICYPLMTRQVHLQLPATASADTASATAPRTPTTASVGPSLWLALLLALGGGLLLNLMPCVLPVLSLKAVTLLEGGESHAAARRHALTYTAGVLASFAVVGLVAVALRLRWGVQLQQPVFVGAVVYLILAMGLGFSGVVQFGAGLGNIGQSLTRRSGPLGDFFTGVLAVVVASACTTPFMGTALAYALNATPAAALAVFLALGLGLALPFLLIGFTPSLARLLPRPGAWMETLKQVLAFPLYLTAAWLAWVLANQRGANAVGLLLVGAVLLALALWWLERSRHRGMPSKVLAGALVLVSLIPLGLIARLPAPAAAAAMETGVEPYSATKLAALRKAGTPVFVDMTADWCTSCQVNEHVVLDTAAFRDLLKRTGTVYMKGDWTNENPQITAFLQQWNSPGVPVYVVFPANGGDGHKLPTILTKGTVRKAIEAAAARP